MGKWLKSQQTLLFEIRGHVAYVTLNQPSIEPLGESLPNSEIFRRLAARMGVDHPLLKDDDVTMIRQALASKHEKMQGVNLGLRRTPGMLLWDPKQEKTS